MGLVGDINDTFSQLGQMQSTAAANQGQIAAQQASTLGQIHAQVAENSARLWSGFANNVAKMISEAPERLAQEQYRAKQNTLADLNIQEAQGKVSAQQRLQAEQQSLQQALGETGGDIDKPESQQKLLGSAPTLFPAMYDKVAEGRKKAFDAQKTKIEAENMALQQAAEDLDGINEVDGFRVWTDKKIRPVNPGLAAAFDAQPYSKELKEKARLIGLGTKDALDAQAKTLSNFHAALQNKETGVDLATKANAWVGNTLSTLPTSQWAEWLDSGFVAAGVPTEVLAVYKAIRPDDPQAQQKAGQMAQTQAQRDATANTKADNERADAQLAVSQRQAAVSEAREARAAGAAGGANAATAGFDEGGLELAATRNRLLGVFPGRDTKANAIISNAAAKQIKELGQSPAQAIQKQAAFKADSGALGKMTTAQASAEAFEAKALGEIPIIQDLSAKVDRSKWPIFNAALLAGKKEIQGDSNTTQLYNAIASFTEEYAKIMTGTTGGAAAASDSARKASKDLINAAMSKGTMTDVLNLMQRQMDLTMMGYDETIKHINIRLGAPATGAAGGGAGGLTSGGKGGPPPGATVWSVGPNGQLIQGTR